MTMIRKAFYPFLILLLIGISVGLVFNYQKDMGDKREKEYNEFKKTFDGINKVARGALEIYYSEPNIDTADNAFAAYSDATSVIYELTVPESLSEERKKLLRESLKSIKESYSARKLELETAKMIHSNQHKEADLEIMMKKHKDSADKLEKEAEKYVE